MILTGNQSTLDSLEKAMSALPVNQTWHAPADYKSPENETTLAKPCRVSGPSTYHRGQTAELVFLPAPAHSGWQFERTDKSGLPHIPVLASAVCNSNRNIELNAQNADNNVRMSEHIICHRLGLEVDNVIVRMPSEDPPLFDLGSIPIVDAIRNAGICEIPQTPVTYWTVSEPVTMISPNNQGFLTILPAPNGNRLLSFDVAIDFPNAIGRQRIQFDLTLEAFAYGAQARTNCNARQMALFRYFRWLIPSIRGFGYTKDNILVAGKKAYVNTPNLIHDGVSLEAVWHRSCLDLIAALSLAPAGRLAGKVISYKSGHTLDCQLMKRLAEHYWTKLA